MHLEFQNVNDAFVYVVEGIEKGTIRTERGPSRVGEVLTIQEPVILTFHKPEQRVLFNVYRDCNPFFHLYEAMWMLAGRNDIASLEYYSSHYGDFVRDGDSPDANGAYGYRWREHPRRNDDDEYEYGTVDQLDILVEHLKKNPNSRRAVLQMWTVEDDLLKIGSPVGYSKDVCCNTNVYFSLREVQDDGPSGWNKYLDMTVCNRSNDIVLGMLGANYVHFSLLQEYVACCLDVEVGFYHQISNNAHVYTEKFEPRKWLKQPETMFDHPNDDYLIYDREITKYIPLVQDKETFDREVKNFVELNKNSKDITGYASYKEPFLNVVAQPMMHAFHMHKVRDYPAAYRWLQYVENDDWRIAGVNWIKKRRENWEAKTMGGGVG